jgi:hypothetical protein
VLSSKSYNWDGPRPDDEYPDHEQPTGFYDDDDWEFNIECECGGCLEHHITLYVPVEGCSCEACENMHAELEGPVDGCPCEHCISLDKHEASPSWSAQWPWRFNQDCACKRCLDTEFDEPSGNSNLSGSNPWGDAPSPAEKLQPENSEILFKEFQKANARTMRRGASWSVEEDAYLLSAYFENKPVEVISIRLMRSEYALVRRLIRHLLEDKGMAVKSDDDVDYLLDDNPWAESDRLACKALFRSGFSPIGIASALKRRPLSVAAELIRDADLFRS